jgi:small subunit ribosomal protein S1
MSDQNQGHLSGPAAEIAAAQKAGNRITGKVIGWNKGGFHVVVNGMTGFCPVSEMEADPSEDPKSFVDQEFEFSVLEIEDNGRRVVLTRSEAARGDQPAKVSVTTSGKLEVGATVSGRVASITDFGAFVVLTGGVQGLVHVSELSRSRVAHPSDVVSEGEELKVKILKIDQKARRISLSRKALEPDPWTGMGDRLQEGMTVTGLVEKTEAFGALIQIEPGLTGLLPTSEMSLPRDTSPARAFPKGREVQVQIVSIDPRRRRISLAPKGTMLGGSKSDFETYKKVAKGEDGGAGFNALEAAFRKIQPGQ